VILEPAGGMLESGAEVRMTTQPSQLFTGSTKFPVNVAPSASSTVSPQVALFKAPWKSPPAGTAIVKPVWRGIDVSMYARGSSGMWAGSVCEGDGGPVGAGGDGGSTDKLIWRVTKALEDEAATCTVSEDFSVCVGTPEITPVDAPRLRPRGSLPDATVQAYGWMPPWASRAIEYGA
jgi:hypothetical protein